MGVTDHKCLTCGSPILDNTTSTTACVKCARLRTRRMNFAHPPPQLAACAGGSSESRDSGVSGGSEEAAGESSPAPRPARRDSVQFSTLVRKLSEVEGIRPSHILR